MSFWMGAAAHAPWRLDGTTPRGVEVLPVALERLAAKRAQVVVFPDDYYWADEFDGENGERTPDQRADQLMSRMTRTLTVWLIGSPDATQAERELVEELGDFTPNGLRPVVFTGQLSGGEAPASYEFVMNLDTLGLFDEALA